MSMIKETWGEIGDAIGYSPSWTARLFYWLVENGSNFPNTLKHWLGPGRRIRMDDEEIVAFKEEIRTMIEKGSDGQNGLKPSNLTTDELNL